MLAQRSSAGGFNQSSHQNMSLSKKARRLYLGNMPNVGMTPTHMVEFFNTACKTAGVAIMPGDPVIEAYVSPEGKYGFLEFRSIDECTAGIALNGITFQGSQLTVRRPNDYEPAPDYIPTNISLCPGAVPTAGVAMAAMNQGFSAVPAAAFAPQVVQDPPSTVLVLENMVSEQELQEDSEYQEIFSETKEECEKFGPVVEVKIPRVEPGMGKIFVLYGNSGAALQARDALQGRMFDGKAVKATFMSESKFKKGDLSDW